MYRIKLIFLYLSKWIGLFRLSKGLARGGLRILCYHSFSSGDEVSWRPKLFIRPETFRKRMQLLEKEKFPVLELDQAFYLLSENKLPPAATVITIDDGWFAIKLYAYDILKEKSFPYTIYLTSYYSLKETPIFSLVVQYMFWKTRKDRIDLKKMGIPLSGTVQLSDLNASEQAMNLIIKYGQTHLDNPERCALANRLGECLGISYSEIKQSRILSLLNAAEIREMTVAGVDFQLHAHRHRWPSEEQSAIRELDENKSFLEPLVGKHLDHFCYPSGLWKPEQLPFLSKAGIKSATTCEPGLNYPSTHSHTLGRFLDSESIHHIEFEAEMSGYLELLRNFRERITSRLKSHID